MFKPTPYEETHPSSVDFRLQNYNKKMTHANFVSFFYDFYFIHRI